MTDKKKKPKKERAKQYEEKLAIDGTLDDVLKVSVAEVGAQKKEK